MRTMLALLVLAPSVLAQDISSGPDKGAAVPALPVYDATGPNKEKTVDYAAERKDKPTIYLVIRADKFDRPMNKFAKTLDGVLKKDFEGAYMVAVWVTEDADKSKEFLPRVQMSVMYEVTALTVFAGKDGPTKWNINQDAHLTVVIAAKGKVAATFGYNTVNDTDVRGVVAAFKKALESK